MFPFSIDRPLLSVLEYLQQLTSSTHTFVFVNSRGSLVKYDCVYKTSECTYMPLEPLEEKDIFEVTDAFAFDIHLDCPLLIHPMNRKVESFYAVLVLAGSTTYDYTTLSNKAHNELDVLMYVLQHNKLLSDTAVSDITTHQDNLILANISHEIRTPLNGIIGYAQLMDKTHMSTVQKEYISAQKQCGLQLVRIINDVLDYSKLSSGRTKLNNVYFNLEHLIHNVYYTMKKQLDDRAQVLEITNVNVPEYLFLDKTKFEQILVNLISNSNKYADKQTTISLRLRLVGDQLCAEVQDRGHGIAEYDQHKLFNIFTQLETHTQEEKNGTGLGLVICKKLVELMGGQITFKSKLNEGSTFSFTVKYNEKQFDPDDLINLNLHLLKGKRVLIVDDNRDNRIILSGYMYNWGMEPVVCASGVEALHLVNNGQQFDIGLIDIVMPGMDGYELAEQLYAKSLTNLIAISSISDIKYNYHFTNVIYKPIDRTLLFTSIVTLLKEGVETIEYNKEKDGLGDILDQRILIVEDVKTNRDLLIRIVENIGFKNIVSVSDGVQFAKIVQEQVFDVVLLDLKMPQMNGFEALDYMESHKIQRPKTIVVTASVLDEDKKQCYARGIKHIIGKPIHIPTLKSALCSCN
jgi:two-component system, sensor histidine kinase and response regulator